MGREGKGRQGKAREWGGEVHEFAISGRGWEVTGVGCWSLGGVNGSLYMDD